MTRAAALLGSLVTALWCLQPAHAGAQDRREDIFNLVRDGQIKMLQLTIFEPGELNDLRDTWGEGLLHEAVRHNHADVVIWLLQNHCDPNKRTNSGVTPLSFAPNSKSLEIMKILVQNGALIEDLDENGANLLHRCAADGTPEMVEYALSLELDLDSLDQQQRTALMYAADSLNVETARALLGHLPMINAQDRYGRTALHCASDPDNGWSEQDKYTIAQMLLNAGADPDIQDRYDRLPCDRSDSWDVYFLLAPPTGSFRTQLTVALISATVLCLVVVLIWRGVSR